MSFTLATTGFSARQWRGIVAIDLTDLLDQPGIVIGDTDDFDAMAGRRRPARHLLDQPGAKRVELAHLGHIHGHFRRPLKLRRKRGGQGLQRRNIGRGPGPARTQLKHIA